MLGVVTVAAAAQSSGAIAQGFGFPLGDAVFARSLARGADGNIWFAASDSFESEKSQRIGRISVDGEVEEYTVAAPAGFRFSIATGADGNLWFTEGSGIGRLTPAGEVTAFPLPDGGTATAVAPGPAGDGNIWFAARTPDAIGRISPAGEVTEFPLSTGSTPTAITAGPAGDLWFVEPKAGRVGRVTTAGELSGFALSGGRTRPNSIALGRDGNLWFGEESKPRVGRITPGGDVTFFPVPTISGTSSLVSGPGGLLWFAAGNELGAINTSGTIRWPACLVAACNYPPAAFATGPDGRLWVASGPGHCPSYCGGGSEISYLYEEGGLGPFAPAPVPVGIGPRLTPLRHRHISVLLGCGRRTGCRGVIRLRAVARPPGRDRTSRLVSTAPYSLAAGASRRVRLPLARSRLNGVRYATGYLVLTAVRGGSIAARRGFFFWPRRGGTAER